MKKQILLIVGIIGLFVAVTILVISHYPTHPKKPILSSPGININDPTKVIQPSESSHTQPTKIPVRSFENKVEAPLSPETPAQARSIRVQPRIQNRKQKPLDSIPAIDPEKSVDMVLQSGHVHDVADMVVDPSGRFLVSYGEYGSIKIWDIETGQVLRDSFHGRREPGNSLLAMDPQGRFFATGANDGKVMIWSLYSNRLIKIIGEKKNRVNGVVINQAGQVWISFLFRGTQLWDINQDSPIASNKGRRGPVISGTAADAQGRYCITFNDRNFSLVDSQTGHVLKSGHLDQKIVTAAMSPSGKTFALGNGSGNIQLRDTGSFSLNQTVIVKRRQANNRIPCIRISPNEKTLVTGLRDISLWNIETGEMIHTLTNAHNRVTSLAFDPEGRYLFSGGMNGEIQMWDVDTGNRLKMFTALTRHHEFMVDTTAGISVDPDFRHLVTESGDGKINVWDLTSLKMVKSIKAQKLHQIKSSSKMDPRGRFLATCYRQGAIKLWDLETGSQKYLFQEDLPYYNLEWFAFDPGGKYLLTTYTSTGKIPLVYIRSLKTGQILKRIEGYHKMVVDPESRFIAGTTPTSDMVNIYALPSGNLIHTYHTELMIKNETSPGLTFPGRTMPVSTGIRQLIMGPNGSHLLVVYYSGRMDVIDTKTGHALKDFRKGISFKHPSDIKRLAFDPSGKYIIYKDRNTGLAGIWKTDTGKLVCSVQGHNGSVTNVIIHPEKKLAVTVSYENIKLWDLSSGALIRTIKGVGFKEPGLDPHWKYIVVNTFDKPQKWDLSTGEMVKTLNQSGHIYQMVSLTKGVRTILVHQSNGTGANGTGAYGTIAGKHPGANTIALIDPFTGQSLNDPGLRFKGDYNKLLVSGNHVVSVDGRILTRIHNIVKKTSVALISSGPEWIIFTPDGYFDSSKYGGSLVAIVKNLNAYGPDQFALGNNRPDLILQNLGLGTEALIAHFYQQYHKRLRKFGFNQNQFTADYHVPDAVFLSATQEEKITRVKFRLNDTKFGLKSYNIYINDVPLFGRSGKKIQGKDITLTEEIELTSGQNKIEISCFNLKGVESYRSITFAEYNQRIKPDLYYIGFGVSKYKDPSLNLNYAHKDAKDLAVLFSNMKGAYNHIYTKVFIDQDVTRHSMDEAMAFLKNAAVDDVLVLFIAGHGLHDTDKGATYYYLGHATDINRLASTAIPYSRLEDLLTDVTPRKKLLLMDTCESGEIDETTQDVYFTQAGAGGFKPRTTRAIVVRLRKQQKKTPRAFLWDKDRFIYNDLIRRSGSVAFSSSRGNEFSYESSKIQNGFFTKGIINALTSRTADDDHNKYLSVKELQTHITAMVAEMSDDLQHPTIDRDNIHQEIELPVLLAALPHENRPGKDNTSFGYIPKDQLHWYMGDPITIFSENRADTGVLRSIDTLHVSIDRGGPDKPDTLGIPHSNIQYIALASDSGKIPSKKPRIFAGIPLLDAAAQGDLNKVKQLLRQGADIHAKTYNEHTALTCALKFGRIHMAEFLMDNGADVNARTLDGFTPIFYAVWDHQKETVERLIKKGADVNVRDSYGRPLIHCAVGIGPKGAAIVELLLDNGAGIDTPDKNGQTPLHAAASIGSVDMANLLIKKGLDVNTKAKNSGLTPLHIAVVSNQADMVKLLLDTGADVNLRNYIGDTPLKMAKRTYGRISKDMIALLNSYGAVE